MNNNEFKSQSDSSNYELRSEIHQSLEDAEIE